MSTLELENQQVPGVEEAAESAEAAKKAAVEAVAEASRANDNAERAIDVATDATNTAKEATKLLEENIDKIDEAYDTANEAKEAVATETAAREADRDALQTNINLEVMARMKDRDNLQANINAEVEARTKADQNLKSDIDVVVSKSGELENEVAQLKQRDTDLENDITTLRTDMTTADTALNERLDTVLGTVTTQGNNDFVDNIGVDGNESTVSVLYTKKKVNGGASGTETPVELPVANASQAGVMNPAMFNSLQETAEKVDTLTNAVVAVNDLPANPTQEQLTDAWKQATGKTELVNGAEIYDDANNKQWTYYSNLGEWKAATAGGASVTVEQFTNTEAGIIKGSENKYQVFAEPDGTGSVNGLDALETSVSTNSSDIAKLKVDMETESTRTKNLPSQVVYNASTTEQNPDTVKVNMLVKDLHTNGDATIPMEITGATTTKSGVMTTAQVEALNTATSDITSIKAKDTEQDTQIQTVTNDVSEAMGDVAAIQADYVSKTNVKTINGESIVGSGDITVPKLYDDYGTNTDGAMTQKAMNDKLNNTTVGIGSGASATGANSVALGENSTVSANSGVAIGRTAKSKSDYGIAIGSGAQADLEGIAIGCNANTNSKIDSIALGALATNTRNYELALSSASGGMHIANVKDGELDTDAVNKKQMEDYVAANTGGGITRVNLTLVGGALVPQEGITAEMLKSGDLFMLVYPDNTKATSSPSIKATKADGTTETIRVYQPTVESEVTDSAYVVKNGFLLVYYGTTKNQHGNDATGLIASSGARQQLDTSPQLYRVERFTGTPTPDDSNYINLVFANGAKGFGPHYDNTGKVKDFYFMCDRDVEGGGRKICIRIVQGTQLYRIRLNYMSANGALKALPNIKARFAYHIYAASYITNPDSEYTNWGEEWIVDSIPFEPYPTQEWELLKTTYIDSGGIAPVTNYQFKASGGNINWPDYRRFKIVFDGYTANGTHSNELIVYGNDNEWDPDVKVDAKWWSQALFNINSAGTSTPTSAHVYNDNRGLYVSNHPARTINVQQRLYGEFIWQPTSAYKQLSGFMDVAGVTGKANTIWHLDGHCTTNDRRAWPSAFNTLNFSFSYGDGTKVTVWGSKY